MAANSVIAVSPHTRRLPPLPDTLETPDIGFIAACGVYLGVICIAALVAVGIAAGWTVPTIIGSLSSAGTVGLIAGALLANRLPGLPERLGERRRRQLGLLVPPAVFAALSALVLLVPGLPRTVAAGTVFGAIASLAVGVMMISMVQTRYARAITPEEPILSVPRQHHGASQVALVFASVAVSLAVVGSSVGVSWWTVLSNLFFVGLFFGFFFLLLLAQRASNSEPGGSLLKRLAPDDQGATRFGQKYAMDAVTLDTNPDLLPTLEVYELGIVLNNDTDARFVPWDAIADVRLTEEYLRFERPRWVDIRCPRGAITDSRSVYEEVQRVRRAAVIDSS